MFGLVTVALLQYKMPTLTNVPCERNKQDYLRTETIFAIITANNTNLTTVHAIFIKLTPKTDSIPREIVKYTTGWGWVTMC